MTKYLTAYETALLIRSMARSISRAESELRYAQSGRGRNNPGNVAERLGRLKKLRMDVSNATNVALSALPLSADAAREVAEWVGYYHGLQRVGNMRSPGHGDQGQMAINDLRGQIEAEMKRVEAMLPPGTLDAWPRVVMA